MKRLSVALAAVVVLKMIFHAVYVPAFEGPDEPQHLARIWDFAKEAPREAFEGKWVPREIVASVLAHPCPHPELGCPSYAAVPGTFDILSPGPRPEPPGTAGVHRIPNEEAKQPPLFYLVAGLPLRIFRPVWGPAAVLLYARLLGVALVAVAMWFPLRRLFGAAPMACAAGLVALTLPGAAEAFARCSNDAAVFLWAACVLAALERPPARLSVPAAAALLAIGPLLKLTALPVVAFAVVALWRNGRHGAALSGAAASFLVFPVQAFRGWLAGGALELARQGPNVNEPLSGWITGFAKTAYTLVKAPFWAMGWSLLRPPGALLAVYLVLLLATLAALDPASASSRRRVPAHATAAFVTLAGIAAFAIATRRYFGVWGSVTGWYVWDWSPWLGVASRDLARVRETLARLLLLAAALFSIAANLAWFAASRVAWGG